MRTFTSIMILSIFGTGYGLKAQEVKVEISYDTVYVGNAVAIRFSMDDWQGDMVNPDFGEMKVVGGPQMTSSTSYSGGRRSSSKTITYFLKPPETPSVYFIPPQTFKGKGNEVITRQVKLIVLDNPEGIAQKPVFDTRPVQTFNRQYRRSEPDRGQRQRF